MRMIISKLLHKVSKIRSKEYAQNTLKKEKAQKQNNN